jgi:hypothetical protein
MTMEIHIYDLLKPLRDEIFGDPNTKKYRKAVEIPVRRERKALLLTSNPVTLCMIRVMLSRLNMQKHGLPRPKLPIEVEKTRRNKIHGPANVKPEHAFIVVHGWNDHAVVAEGDVVAVFVRLPGAMHTILRTKL